MKTLIDEVCSDVEYLCEGSGGDARLAEAKELVARLADYARALESEVEWRRFAMLAMLEEPPGRPPT